MALNKQFKKWDIVLVNLDPVIGKEISKTRPCLIISPNVMNKYLHTLIVAPLTSSQKNYPSRLRTNFKGRPGEICFDHIKSIDKSRIVQVLGSLENNLRKPANELLKEMFSEE
jgi:mRNA interferase MazF